MKNFNFQTELQKIIEKKQLVAVRFKRTPEEFKVVYLLDANDEFTTIAEIDNRGELDGVCMYHSDEINSVSTYSQYLSKLEKKIDPSTLKRVLSTIENVKEFSFTGLASAIENTDTLVEVEYENGFRPVGKITGHDEQALFLTEFDDESKEPLAHFLIKFSAITCMSLDIPYMRDIVASLKK